MKGSTRTLLNRILNFALLLSGAFMLGSAWVIDQRLGHGHGQHGIYLLGLTHHNWTELHTIVGYAMGVLVLAHLALHTAWLQRIAAQRRPWLLIAGFGSVMVMLLAMLFLPTSY